MTPPNFKWDDLKTVKKGNFAEKIVDDFLEEKGFVIYNPSTKGPHAFDRLAIREKKDIIIAECKAKASRKYYPDTGINYKHYKEYKYIENKYKIPVFIFFIDELKKQIYGNFLTKLEQKTENKNIQYPFIQKTKKSIEIIYFPLLHMINVCNLDDEQVKYLKENSTRNYEY
jgi:Holliday junction resolvase